jgi:tRNA dimethylallyltransferase
LPREDSTRYPQAQQFGLKMDRTTLDQRIEQRVEKMWERGLEVEVEALIGEGLLEGKTAQAALGYAQIIAAGMGLCVDAKTDTKIATRQYARRQETWFTRDARINWLEPASPQVRLERVLASIIKS